MIMMCVICMFWNKHQRRIDDRSANWRSNEHNRREKTRHDQASTYKELCKGRATELYNYCRGETTKKIFFHIFIYMYIFIIFLLLSNI